MKFNAIVVLLLITLSYSQYSHLEDHANTESQTAIDFTDNGMWMVVGYPDGKV